MEKNRERSDRVWARVSRLLAALTVVALFSCPGAAAIKRFTDEKGTLHISNEGGEGKPPIALSTPAGRSSRIKGPQPFPRPGATPPRPRTVAPPEPEEPPDEPAQAEEEEPPEEPAPSSLRGRSRR